MDSESRELRPHSPSWPPGMHGASARSMVLDRGYQGLIGLEQRVRTYSRAGTTLIALVVCAFSFGYALTEWVCEADRKVAVPARAAGQLAAIDKVIEPVSAGEAARVHVARVEVSRSRPARAGAAKRGVVAVAGSRAVVRATREPSRVEPVVVEHEPRGLDRLQLVADEPAPRSQVAEAVADIQPLPAAATPVDAVAAVAQLRAAVVQPQAAAVHPKPRAAATPVDAVPLPAADELAAVVRPTLKAAAIEALVVEGALTQSVVNRGVSRLLPQYERCGEFADSAPQRLKLSTVIDEAGHGRRILIDGLSKPSLRRCLEQATAHLTVRAPDTGIARARWIVRFASKHP